MAEECLFKKAVLTIYLATRPGLDLFLSTCSHTHEGEICLGCWYVFCCRKVLLFTGHWSGNVLTIWYDPGPEWHSQAGICEDISRLFVSVFTIQNHTLFHPRKPTSDESVEVKIQPAGQVCTRTYTSRAIPFCYHASESSSFDGHETSLPWTSMSVCIWACRKKHKTADICSGISKDKKRGLMVNK